MYKKTTDIVTPDLVAKYFLLKAKEDGDLVSPLKIQKLVYYAYAWFLVHNNKKLFNEGIEAWPNGPVVPSLYKQLKKYGSSPINIEEFTKVKSEKDYSDLANLIPEEAKTLLDSVYSKYMILTPFELVMLTHNEKPWKEARKGLLPTQKSNNLIEDENILSQFKK